MSTLLAAEATSLRPARAFLIRYVQTMTVLLGGMAALLLGWSVASTSPWAAGHPWVTSAVAMTGWALGVAGWLRRRGWRAAVTRHAVTWAAPAALLLPLAGLGWMSPDGVVLWGPIATVCAVAVTTAADPAEHSTPLQPGRPHTRPSPWVPTGAD